MRTELPVDSWQPTRDTLHMWTQIVGKIRMALTPPINHWWHVTLYVERSRPDAPAPSPSATAHPRHRVRLHRARTACCARATAVGGRSPWRGSRWPTFYAQTFDALSALGVDGRDPSGAQRGRRRHPVRRGHRRTAPTTPQHAQAFWQQLIDADRVSCVCSGRASGAR